MSKFRKPNQDPFEPPPHQETNASSSSSLFSQTIKWLLFPFLLCSISFVVFSAFANQSRYVRCPACIPSLPYLHHPTHAKETETQTQTNVSHILFGIAGSSKTWENRRNYTELWWKPNITRGYIWFDENPEESDTSLPYKVSEDCNNFSYTKRGGYKSAVRITRIVLESFRLGLENVRWFVMGDDDTVFFVENLAAVLSKYDHNQMYYIGGNSESVEQDVMHSYGMAFGGGGFAISYGLAVELEHLLDRCLDRYPHLYGSDERISACVQEIGVTLTKEPGFHQVDIRGNPYGLLAAHPVAPLVSLHHLDAVDPLFPTLTQLDSLKSLMIAYNMDPGRTLQQTFCHDFSRNWSISVSWGYTAQIYPRLMTAKDLGTPLLTFKTWRSWKGQPFTVNTREVSSDPCDRPIVYFLEQVDGVGDGVTRTSYQNFLNIPGKVCGSDDYLRAQLVHHVNVVALKMDPDEWKMAPRRQCCEIVNKVDGGNEILNLRIRRCSRWESASFP